MHAVLILRGRGHCLVGGEVKPIETRDLVTVPPMTWHQFRATQGRAARLPLHGRTPRATSRSCPRPRIWQSCRRMRRSPRSCAMSRSSSMPDLFITLAWSRRSVSPLFLGALVLRACGRHALAGPAGIRRHLPRAGRDQHHPVGGRHGAGGRGDGGAPAGRRVARGRHPGAVVRTAQGQPGGALARHRRAAAAAPARPSRRRGGKARGLGLRSVQAPARSTAISAAAASSTTRRWRRSSSPT